MPVVGIKAKPGWSALVARSECTMPVVGIKAKLSTDLCNFFLSVPCLSLESRQNWTWHSWLHQSSVPCLSLESRQNNAINYTNYILSVPCLSLESRQNIGRSSMRRILSVPCLSLESRQNRPERRLPHTDKNPHHKSSEKGTCAVDWTKIRTIIRSWH